MSEWKAKRFWKSATAERDGDSWVVALDGRRLKTPAKATLSLPTQALAERIAAEWSAQDEKIDPLSMPFTRSANAAIDKVALQFDEVAELIAAYGDTDLLCYRADGPDPLVRQQAEAWNPLLDWLKSTFEVSLIPTTGIVPVTQLQSSRQALREMVRDVDSFALTAMHDLVSLSGSLVIGLAAINNVFPGEELWNTSRIDENWQESQWGVDEEAAEFAAGKRREFLHALDFYRLSRPDG